jgi:hypothetical protein
VQCFSVLVLKVSVHVRKKRDIYLTPPIVPQEFIAEQCKAMCTLNESRKPNDRYLIVISLDCPNIGTRKRYRDDVMQETDLISEEYFPKMYLHAKSTAYSMSLIIECFDIYVFGEHSKLYVEKWGITGFSMGGIAAALAHTIG